MKYEEITMNNGSKYIRNILILMSFILVSACSGGGGGGDNNSGVPTTSNPNTNNSATNLMGTVASGAAVIGQVTVKGALGNTKSALINADGNYNVDVTGLTAPYRLRAEGTVGGRLIRLHSYAETSDLGGNVNITPFTDLIIANAAQQVAANFFDSQTNTSLDATVLAQQKVALKNKLQSIFAAVGVDSTVDLLRTSFSANHSGLDAALDSIKIEVDETSNVATITNLIDNQSITDNVLDTDDNDSSLTVSNSATFSAHVSDTQAIGALGEKLTQAFANGLPAVSTIQNFFSDDFYEEDKPKSLFLTELTTNPSLKGIKFISFNVSDLDSIKGTAKVTFYVNTNGYTSPDPVIMLVAKNNNGQWQLRGSQRIADMYFDFHCNDNDGTDSQSGYCGLNTFILDNDFTNNGTSNSPITSGTVSIIDGTNPANVKAVIYLGTDPKSSAGELSVYDEGNRHYTGDYKGFGSSAGQINPSIFKVGDIIEYKLYTQALDLSTPTSPQIAALATPVATYKDKLLYLPATTGIFPALTSEAINNVKEFTLGSSLALSWTKDSSLVSDEIDIVISDNAGNRFEIRDEGIASDATSVTIASSKLTAAAASASGLDDAAATYHLLVRINMRDPLTGQFHSTDYRQTIPGPGATTSTGGGGSGTALACNYSTDFDENADGGLGRPVLNGNSFAEFESVIASCGTAVTIAVSDVAGHTFNEVGSTDSTTFNTGTATSASPATGSLTNGGNVIQFQWYLEPATCNGCNYNYLVMFTNKTISSNLPIDWIRETHAITGISGTVGISGTQYRQVVYSEQSNYSDSDRSTGSDGDIWQGIELLQ
jgi:hypothetical protein